MDDILRYLRHWRQSRDCNAVKVLSSCYAMDMSLVAANVYPS